MRQSLVNAPHRVNRREGTATCPFCADITAGRVDPQTQVWLHPNDFPPLQQPIGEAYVVIYSRDHDRPFMQLSVDEVNAVTRLWRDLYTDLAARYATVMIFENSGESIGQTQHHPHGQAYGVSIIPPRMEREHALAGALARFVFSAIPNLSCCKALLTGPTLPSPIGR